MAKSEKFNIYINGELVATGKSISELDLYSIEVLQEKLEEALSQEDFEAAAEIRDKIKEKESK